MDKKIIALIARFTCFLFPFKRVPLFLFFCLEKNNGRCVLSLNLDQRPNALGVENLVSGLCVGSDGSGV